MNIRWKKFNALGTEVIITAFLKPLEEVLLEKAQKATLNFENRFSRFIEGNELHEINNFSGEYFETSDTMNDLLKNAKDFYLKTKGVFDPTIIKSIESVGYDRNFSDTVKDKLKQNKNIDIEKIRRNFLSRAKMDELKISADKIFVPKEFRIDFGGIGKGYIVDFLSEKILGGIKNFWISAGGDLLVKGNDGDKTGWKIGVQNPNEPEQEIFSVKTKGKIIGIATSGIFKRKGVTAGLKWHHIIDPKTGLPVENNILSVTAISTTAQKADVFAKTVLILGEKDGLDFIDKQNNSACIIFFKNKNFVFSKNMLDYF